MYSLTIQGNIDTKMTRVFRIYEAVQKKKGHTNKISRLKFKTKQDPEEKTQTYKSSEL